MPVPQICKPSASPNCPAPDPPTTHRHYLITYDVADDKRWTRLFNLPEDEKDQWDAMGWDEDGTSPDRVEADAVNKWLFNKDSVEKYAKTEACPCRQKPNANNTAAIVRRRIVSILGPFFYTGE